MARAGIPVFVASPCAGRDCTPQCHEHNGPHGNGSGFHLGRWDGTRADPGAVDRWRPGWALCAVGGHSCDFLDIDPRNGGTTSSEQLSGQDALPISYGTQITPSGGRHELIAPLRVGKFTPLPGIDVQGGRPDGTGRGFVFLAPTVRPSKTDGVARPYRWTVEPDTARLLACTGETSGAPLAALMPVKRAESRAAPSSAPGDMSGHFTDRYFSYARAVEFCRPAIEALAAAGPGERNNKLNAAAKTVSHFIGDFWSADQAETWLTGVLDPDYPEAEAAATIASAFRSRAGDWRAVRMEPPAPTAPEAGPGVGTGGFAARLLTVSGLDDLPEVEPLVEGWLYQDTTARLIGQAKSFKSFVSLDIALHVASGRPWHGRAVAQTSVLYVVGEGLRGYRARVASWCAHHKVDKAALEGRIMFTRGSVQIGGQEWPDLAQWAAANHAGLIVIDTQAKATVGVDENSNTDQAEIFSHLDALRQATGGVLLLVHHTGHSNGEAAERGRGASGWRAAVDTELLLTKTGDRCAMLRNDCQKEAESGETVGMAMVEAAGSLVAVVTSEAPTSPRTQWLADQVRAGVRWDSQNSLMRALRNAKVGVRSNDKAAAFQEYFDLVSKIGQGDASSPAPSTSPFR